MRNAMPATLAAALTAALLAAQPAAAQDFIARIGHLESTQQSRHVALEKVAAAVKDQTGGAVEFQIFPQGQLGDQRQMTEGVQLGTLEATVSPAAFLGGFNPVVSVLDIPYLMPEDADRAQSLRESAFGRAILDSFTSRGVVALTLWPNGFKDFTSNKPLPELAAFADQKFRVMDSKILIEQFNALGASAIALPFGELYTSLQTGVVDGQENPLDTIQRMKFAEVQNYLVISEHGAMEDVVLFNPLWWDALPSAYRDIINAAFADAIPDLRAHKEAALATALEDIQKGDIDVRVAGPEERAAMRAAMYPLARAAYEDRAGDEGKAVIALYEVEIAE
jgi:tripartite ATP-independent transporter DctP family solute receptor